MLRLGINLGEISQLLHVYPLLNREYVVSNDTKFTLKKNWSKIPLAVAPISTIQRLKVFEKNEQEFKRIEEIFTKNSTVFMLNKGYYGCQATVSDSMTRNGRIKCMNFENIYLKVQIS